MIAKSNLSDRVVESRGRGAMRAEVTFVRLARVVSLVSVSLGLVILGCSTPAQEDALERNKRLVLRMNDEVWNRGNLEILDEFYSPDFVRHFLPDDSEVRGIDNLRERIRMHREAYPDWREQIKHVVAEGDLVVIHIVSTGTNEGMWLGNPPTGNSIQIHEMSILRIADGRIAEQWLLPDVSSLRRQLGPNVQ